MWLWWDSDHDSGIQTLICWLQTPHSQEKVGIWVEHSPNSFSKALACAVIHWQQVSTINTIANYVNLLLAKGTTLTQSSRSEAASVKTKKYNKYRFFPALSNCCVPPWLSAGKRIPGHKSFPNSYYLLFRLNTEAAFATFTKIQCLSRISSSHTIPGILTQHSPQQAQDSAIQANLLSLHLPPAQAVTPSQWQTGRDISSHLACFLADYKKGSQQRHFSSFAVVQICKTLQLPIKLWRLL